MEYPANKNKREAFHCSREQFEKMVDLMESGHVANMAHGDLEELLKQEGFELMRRLMQDHLDLRSSREQPVLVVGGDGVTRNHQRQDCPRALETIFGSVEVRRRGYGQRDVPSAYPLDRGLNLPAGRYSHGLEERLADEVAKNSFDNAVASIGANTGGRVPKRQAEELIAKTAQDFDAFYEQRQCQETSEGDSLLVLSLDGKGIVMRKDDLRPATREKAEKQGSPKKRLGSGEKRNRKRMATVASVYSVDEHHRSAEEIMGLCGETKTRRPKPRNKRVWASVSKSAEEVGADLFREALRRDPGQHRRWLMLVDGDPHQLDRVQTLAARFEIDLIVILDFIHVLEYLWKASYAFHPDGSPEAQEWVQERALRILQGKSSDVAAGMRRSATLLKLDGSKREAVDTCAGYLLNNREYLQYDLYLADGFPISTGVIEGACRHLIKDRMDLTGARWGLKSAEAVLRIRSLRSSGDFVEYMRFHREQELRRNHTSRYSVHEMPVAA